MKDLKTLMLGICWIGCIGVNVRGGEVVREDVIGNDFIVISVVIVVIVEVFYVIVHIILPVISENEELINHEFKYHHYNM